MLKKNDIWKSFLCGASVGCLFWNPVFSVSAQSNANGDTSYMSAYGYSYTAYNTVYTGKYSNDGQKYASAYLTNESAQSNLPGGYAGVYPILYDDDDNVLASPSDWYYSSSNYPGITRGVFYYNIIGQMPVMAKGLARIWNGSSYWTYATFATPFLNDYT